MCNEYFKFLYHQKRSWWIRRENILSLATLTHLFLVFSVAIFLQFSDVTKYHFEQPTIRIALTFN